MSITAIAMYASKRHLRFGIVVMSVVCGWDGIVTHGMYGLLLDRRTLQITAGSSNLRCLYIVTFGHQMLNNEICVLTSVPPVG